MSNSSFSLDEFDNISNFKVTQTAHGFAVGDILRTAGTNTYAKAKADSDANAEVAGFVSKVIDANNFKLRIVGRQSGLSGLIADTVYFLSHTTAGAMTTTDPATLSSGFVSKPVLLTDSGTSGMILTYRGLNDGGGGDAGPATLDGLSDVVITSPSSDQILKYNGSNWVNSAAVAGNLDSLTDVVITSPSATQILSYNGSNWVNSAPAAGGGWSLVSTTNTASQSSVSFTGLSSGYEYRWVFENIQLNTDGQMGIRVSSDNGSTYKTDSNYKYLAIRASTAASLLQSVGTFSSIVFTPDTVGSNTTDATRGEIRLLNAGTARATFTYVLHQKERSAIFGTGSYAADSGNIDAVQIMLYTATSFGSSSGSIKLYRLSKT